AHVVKFARNCSTARSTRKATITTMIPKTIHFMIHASAASNDQSPDSGELGGCEGGGALPVCFWSASLRSPCCWSGGFFSWLLPCSCCLRSLLPPLCCECWSGGRPPPLSPGCLPCPLPLSPSCLPWLLPFSPDGCPWEFGLPPWLPEL